MDLDLPLLHHDLVDQRRDKALTSLRSQSSEAPKGPLPADALEGAQPEISGIAKTG